MSLYGMLHTSVSGMNAQSNLLGTVSENIANSGTAGYKAADTEFSSLLLDKGGNAAAVDYQPGAVDTKVRYGITTQGTLNYTSSPTDLAINGNGFFLVKDPGGQTELTRAGAFTVDASTGNLVNTAGLTLMGYPAGDGTQTTLNGTGGLSAVNIGNARLAANASTKGTFTANLPSTATAVTGNAPGSNAADATYTDKSSLVAYDKLGAPVTLDIYMTKTSASPVQWEMSVYDHASAPASGSFPYASGPLVTQTLSFGSNGSLTSAGSLVVPVTNGSNLALDISGMTQLASGYTPLTATVDGNAPGSAMSSVAIEKDGTLYGVDKSGQKVALYKIPFGYVSSPNNLTPVSGNAFQVSKESGDLQVGVPGEGNLGTLVSGATEQSTVDMASELTRMIVAQRDYTANSKVFQTGTDLLDVLMNLKR